MKKETEVVIEDIKSITDRNELEKIRLALKMHLYDIRWKPLEELLEELVHALGVEEGVLVIESYIWDEKSRRQEHSIVQNLTGKLLLNTFIPTTQGADEIYSEISELYQREFESGVLREINGENRDDYDYRTYVTWKIGGNDIDILSEEELEQYSGIKYQHRKGGNS